MATIVFDSWEGDSRLRNAPRVRLGKVAAPTRRIWTVQIGQAFFRDLWKAEAVAMTRAAVIGAGGKDPGPEVAD